MKDNIWPLVSALCLPAMCGRDVPAQKPELILQTGHISAVDQAAFSPNGKLPASGSGTDGLQNLGSQDALVLNMPTHPYNYEDPDHYRLPYDTPEIPYSWEGGGFVRHRSGGR